jgi:anthranilate synthase component 1
MSKLKAKKDRIELNGDSTVSENPYEDLRRYFKSINCGTSEIAPFSGGMVGYLGYDAIRYFEKKLNTQVKEDSPFPDLYFILPMHLVCVDHLNSRVLLISHGKISELREALSKRCDENDGGIEVGEGIPNTTPERFREMILSAKEHILDGDIFQTVLSRRTDFDFKGDPLEMYRALRALNPSPYLFYLDYDKVKIIGSSPEMLVRLENKKLTTRPLAGTRPRSPDPEEDEKLKVEMLLDEKERAEHLMLVDLHRNDMGRVSKYGSVKVTELMTAEKYSHVQHIMSNVESELREDCDGFDALKSCFPAGTVSGAPKVRAMEIIGDLEKDSRGPYAGAVGFFDFTGDIDFAITIRSITVFGNRASVQAGAGIVADSVPEREYAETEHKMGATLQALRTLGGRR